MRRKVKNKLFCNRILAAVIAGGILSSCCAAHNEIMDGLLSGRFDFGLTTGRLDHPKIISVPLWKDRYTLLVGARHPMARRRKIYLQDIQNEKICALPEDQSKLRIVDELCKKAGFEPDFVLEGNVELLSDYMREGLGVSFGLASVRDAYRVISVPYRWLTRSVKPVFTCRGAVSVISPIPC